MKRSIRRGSSQTRRSSLSRARAATGRRFAWAGDARLGHELLEDRTLLSADLTFAVAGPSGGQDLAVADDSGGNVYVLGTDAVYKYSASGTQLWAAPHSAFGALNQKEGIAVDASGNAYITGVFLGGATFGSTSLTSAGNGDGFLAKLDTNGNFLWAESFGGTGGDAGYGVAVDAAGDAYVTGDYGATATFGQGANTVTLNCAGWTDAFVAKFNPSGDLDWAQGIGGTGPDAGRGIAVDSQGDAYVTGQFSGTVDFDPANPGLHQLTTSAGAAYILKLDGGGNYQWAEQLNGTNPPLGTGTSAGGAIAVDRAGNVYATGSFGGTVDLDPSSGTQIVQSNFGAPDEFVLKLDATGGFVWARSLRNLFYSAGFTPNGIAVDGRGNVYTTGSFTGSGDFDPGASIVGRTSAGDKDAYVSILDQQGNFAGVAVAGEAGSDFGWGIAVTAAGNVDVAGSFSNTIDFDPGSGVDNVTANGIWDGFVWGLSYPPQAIAGVVWNDQNGDGIRQSDEPGIPGTPVTLYQGTPGSGVQVASTISDSLGLYSFKGLSTGISYYIQVSSPPGDTFTAQNAGSDPTLNSVISPATGGSGPIVLSANQTAIANAGFQVPASAPTFGLAFGVKTGGFVEGSSIVSDATGNFYLAGSFDGTAVFGSGPGAVSFFTGANNDFVAKYSPNGALIWVRRAESSFWEYGPKLQLDPLGNVYVAGSITGQTTFGSTVIAASAETAFLWKLDSDGNTLWVQSVIGGVKDNSVGMAIDAVGNAFVVGAFAGTTTIGTSPNPTTLTSVGDSDIFIVRYNSDGSPLWAKSFGTNGAGFSYDGADSVAVDSSGNPVITGSYENNLQLGLYTLTGGFPQSDFVAKFDGGNGSVLWAVKLASSSDSGPNFSGLTTPLNRIALDAAGNVYTTGRFDGTLQLDPTNGTDLTPFGSNATFISKLDSRGRFVWGKALLPGSGGYDVEGYAIALDQQGNVYTTGEFARTLNFNPAGTPAANLTAIGSSYDIYISKLDKDGNYVSALQFGGSGEDQATAISVDASGNVYATGISQGPANFSPPPGTYNVGASGEQDIFVLRLNGIANAAAVNAAPSFVIAGPTQDVLENAGSQSVPGFIADIVAGPPGESNEVLTAAVSNDNSALFSAQPTIDLATGALTYTPATDAAGVAQVTITLHNNGGTAGGGADTFSQTFTITVDAVNQPPSFTAGPDETVNENAGAQTVTAWATNVSAGPPNESGQAVNFIVTSDNAALFSAQPAIDPTTGDLTFTPASFAFGVAHVTVVLHDNGGTANGGVDTSVPQTFTITVNYVNQAPSFTAGGGQTVDEDAGAQTVSGWATNITAGEAGQSLDFQVRSDNGSLFSAAPAVDPTTGNLTYTAAANAFGVAHVTVALHDNGGTANGGVDTSAPQTFTITVNSVNDAPSFTAGSDQTVNEDGGAQTVAGWATNISAGPPNEAGQVLDFQVSSDNSSLFSAVPTVDPATGDLTFTPAANAFGVAHVTVVLHDNGGTANGGVDASAPQTFTITVNSVNDAPSFVAGGDQTVNEDAGAQIVSGWATGISPGPANEAGQTLDFQVSSDNSSLFSSGPAVDQSTGDLIYTPAANAFGVAHVTVMLHDNGGTANGGVDTSAPQTFTITVNSVNDAPSFTAGADQTVNEDAGAQTVGGWATGISAGPPNEASQVLDFQVSSDNSSLFSSGPVVDPSTGDLTYTPAANANGVAHVTVMLHDDGGTANGGVDTSAPQVFTITVNPVNDPPSFTAGGDQTVNEDAGAQAVAGWATGISPGAANEAGQSLTFLVSSDNSALFSAQPSVDPATGALTYTPAANEYGIAHVTVVLHDDGGTADGGVDTSAPQTFTITVNFVNQAPSFTAGPDQTVNEDAGPQTAAAWATNMSAGPANEAGQKLSFSISSDNDALFSVQPTVDLATGNLTYTPAPNAYGVAHVTAVLRDDGGTANGGIDASAPVTFTITVNPVNDAPSFAAGGDQTVNEDAGPQSVIGWAANISAGPANEASQVLDFEVGSDNSALFASGPAIDPATGDLTYTPAPNANGVAHVTVMLHDDGGTANGGVDASVSQTFTITVNPVNDAPSFTAGADQTVNEDAGAQTVSGWATNISAGPANEAGQTLTFQVSSDNLALFSVQPSIDPTTGALTYTPAPNANGVAHVTVSLHDNGGTADGGVDTSAPQTFTITVNSVNDAPSFTAGPDQTIKENSGEEIVVGWAKNISAGPLNESSQTLSFQISSDNPALFSLQPTIDLNGILTYQAAPHVNGVAHVTVQLFDNGGTANGGSDASAPVTFTITVNPVNEAPSFTAGANQTLDEDAGPQTVAGWATNISAGPNEAGQTVNFLVSSDNSTLFSVQPTLDAAGNLSYTPAANAYGTANVTVVLHDNGGTANGGVDTSSPQTFTITINPVNDPPSFTLGADPSVNEDSGPQLIAGWATNISAGPNEAGQALNFLVSSDNSTLFSAQPTLDPLTGTLTFAPAANAYGVAHVTVALHDDGGTANGGVDTSASQTFTITINAVNHAPSFTAGGNQTVNEDAGPQSVSGWATAISAGANEASQTLDFLVSSDNSGLFSSEPSIDPATGTLSYTPAANASGVAHVSVQLHDNGGTANGGVDTSAAQTFTITVNSVNDAPSFTAGSDQSVNQDSGPQTVAWATNISAGPNEAGQTLNFLVADDNPSLFAAPPAIDSSGVLTYTPAAHASGIAHVTVQLHDNGGTANGGVDTSAPLTFTINVNFVNQPPSFTAGSDQAVNENASAQTVASWATNINQGAFETGQTLDFQVSSDNSALFSAPPAIDASGTLTYTPAPNMSGVAHVTVALHDNGGTANGGQDTSAQQTFTITINPVNQAPSFLLGLNETVDEDSGPQSFAAWAKNISAGPNESSQTVNFVVSSDNPGLFSAAPAVDAAGNLTFTPALHKSGSAIVTVSLHDDGGTANGGVDATAPQTFLIAVNPVNHAPTVVSPIADQTLNENSADLSLDVSGVFDDVDLASGDHLTLSLAGNDNNALVGATLSDGVLTFHLFRNQIGAAHLDLHAVDDSGASVDDSFTVTVNAVNQPPSFVKGADQRVPENSGLIVVGDWATGISAGPANEAGQTLNFQIAGNTNPALFLSQPSVDPATGALSFAPAPGVSGTATISLVLKDSGGTANGGQDTSGVQTFHITINGAPIAQADTFVLSDRSANAAAASGVLSNDTDPNGDALTARLVSGPSHGTLTLNADGSFSYVKGADFSGLDEFTYQANDGLADSAAVTVRIVSYQASIVDKLYEQVLNRDPEDNGLLYWTGRIQNGDPYSAIAQGIFESNERLDPIIERYYHDFLLRSADDSGLAYWRDQVWKRDGGPENVIAGMISSPEFFQSAGGTNADWIQALYQRLLNRTADSQGLSFWENQLDQHSETEEQVVLGFTNSDENYKNLITGFFQQYLQRAPSASELSTFLTQMQAGSSQRDIQIEIIDSDEYRNTPPPPASGVAARFVP